MARKDYYTGLLVGEAILWSARGEKPSTHHGQCVGAGITPLEDVIAQLCVDKK
jgi:hypothetical protein